MESQEESPHRADRVEPSVETAETASAPMDVAATFTAVELTMWLNKQQPLMQIIELIWMGRQKLQLSMPADQPKKGSRRK